jgi:hypothetical protein
MTATAWKRWVRGSVVCNTPSSGRFPPRLVDDYMAAEGGSVFDKVIALPRPEIIEVVTMPACEVGALPRLARIEGQRP